jgi:four helix bundle protein
MDEGRGTKSINSVRDLEVYKLTFESAMEIFELSKNFPKEEIYSLIDQIRRSSRSVCTNLAEGCLRPRGC